MSNLINALSRRFSISISNTDTTAKTVALLSGIFEGTSTNAFDATELTKAGYSVDAIAMDGIAEGTKMEFKSTSPKRSIKQFKDFIRHNPTMIRKIVIQANNSDVFNSELELVNYTPLTGVSIESVGLNEFYDRYQNATDKIEINLETAPEPIFLDANTLMFFNIGAGRQVTFTFIF